MRYAHGAALVIAGGVAATGVLASASVAFAVKTPWPAYCAGSPPARVPPLNHGALFNPDDHSDLVLGTPGLPDQTVNGAPVPTAIAAGNGWHEFQMTVRLPLQGSNTDLTGAPHDVKWIAFVSNGRGAGNPNSAHVQYLDSGTWTGLGQWAGARTKLVTTGLSINNSSQTAAASLQLRFKIDTSAPPGPVYLVEFGSYVDALQACTHFTFDANMIAVDGPGSTPGSAPGSSRSLPYAGAGAVVLVAGAAMALAARRRKRHGRHSRRT